MRDDRITLEMASPNNHGIRVCQIPNVTWVTLEESTQQALRACYEVPNQSFRHGWRVFYLILLHVPLFYTNLIANWREWHAQYVGVA